MNSTDPEEPATPARDDTPEGATEPAEEDARFVTVNGLSLEIEEGFITLPIRGKYEDQKPSDPKFLRIRTDVYVEDLIQRDFFGANDEQGWDTGFIASLSNCMESVLRRCSHPAANDIAAVAEALRRATVPTDFEEHGDKTKIPITHPLREPLSESEKKETAPDHIWWRPIFNRDLIGSQRVDGKWHQEAFLVANVAEVPIGVVHRMSIKDFIKIQHVIAEYRKKAEATSP